MALAAANKAIRVPGSEFEVYATITGDASYPAGGYLLTPALFGLNAFLTDGVTGATVYPIVIGSQYASAAVEVDVDNTGHLRVFYPSGGGAASPAALGAPAIASGAVAMTSAAANGSADLVPGQAKEVATATNLSTLSIVMLAIGH